MPNKTIVPKCFFLDQTTEFHQVLISIHFPQKSYSELKVLDNKEITTSCTSFQWFHLDFYYSFIVLLKATMFQLNWYWSALVCMAVLWIT